MSVRAPRGRGARQTAAVIESTVIITLTVADSAPIVVTDSIPHCEVDEVVAFEDSYPASLPPLGEDSYPASLPPLGENTQPEEDSPEIKATQAALDAAVGARGSVSTMKGQSRSSWPPWPPYCCTSAMVRETSLSYLTRAGVEIGVASTKAFTTQLTTLMLLVIAIGRRFALTDEVEKRITSALFNLPGKIESVLKLDNDIKLLAEQFAEKQNALFLGRGSHYPIAMEGALKLKEISYIHAEAYPAGELKHGPLALVDSDMPVVVIAPNDALLEKVKSNMQEVKARGGRLYVFADQDTEITSSEGINVIRLPEHYGNLSPILHVVPLQLLAYHTACARGTDVDKPRNLAKSVTVE